MKKYSYLTIALFFSILLQAQPGITSFSPASGPAGTTVTITGINFNTTPGDNIVFFGAVKAVVSAATSTSLTVTAPLGASYQPISVTTGGLTAFSQKPFLMTFAGGGTITSSSFGPHIDSSAALNPYTITTSDIDGDGNPDLLTANKDSNSVSVLVNTTVGGAVSFAYRVNLACTFSPYAVHTADWDNDGKQDITVTTFNGFSFFRNTSTPGSLSFEPRVDIATNILGFMRDITSGDFDGDGKTDIAIADQQFSPVAGIISVYRNTSTPGSISFAPRTTLTSNTVNANSGIFCIRAADLDGDGKTDLTFTYNSSFYAALRNTSTPGNLIFNPALADMPLTPGCAPRGLAIGDLNNDNKPDLVIASHFKDTLSVIRNTSTPGNTAFAIPFDYAAGSSPRAVSINDMDGDGRPDIVTANVNFSALLRPPLLVFRNLTTGTNIVIAPRVNIYTIQAPWSIALVDLNRDGKPDIATSNSAGSPTASILKNSTGTLFSLCPGGNISINASLTGSSYQWQVSTDSVNFTAITNNSNYGGATTSTLQISNTPSAWYGYQYRCVVDGTNSAISTIRFTNEWTGLINNQWEEPFNWSCGTVPNINTFVIINYGTVVLNTNTSIRSLQVNPAASFTIASGVTLTITH